MVVFVGAVAAGATGAFFTDTATATGNTFTAGTLDLQISETSSSSGFANTQNSSWNFSAMAPGGTPASDTMWLRNVGSVDGMTLGVGASVTNASTPNPAPQVRITGMTLDGENVLEGGAGAVVPDYEAPTNCTVTLSGSDRITDAIFNASTGDIICASGSNYSLAWEQGATNWQGGTDIAVHKEVTLVTVGGPSQTASIPFRVTADNVTIKGFEITNPNGTYGVYITDADNTTVTENHIHSIGSSLATGSAQGIYLKASTEPVAGADFTHNRIEDIGNPSLLVPSSGSSAKGVFIGDTSPSHGIDDVLIAHNVINNVSVSNVSFGSGGRGAYGVLVNHAGGTTNLIVEHNFISNLSGWWEQGVSLFNNTPGAIVRYNDMSDFDGAVGSAAGVNVEGNSGAASVVIEKNNFNDTVATGVLNQTALAVTAQNNWWGGFTTNAVDSGGGSVDTSNFAGGAFVGYVNGADFNGNGFADLDDLVNTPATGIVPGLNAGETREFTMAVQYDGPTTDNAFQGAQLGVTLEFTLNQQ